MYKKLIQINTVCNGSIGRIMKEIQKQAEKEGFRTISFVGRRQVFEDLPCEKFGNSISFWTHVILNTIFDKQGYGSWLVTQRLIRRLREENPDIIHLHNLHGYYLHISSLMKYLAEEYEGKVFWTFHDCWPFTGHCPYFTMADCNKWETQCHHCPNKGEYPVSWFLDASKSNYLEKKKWFTGIGNLTITVPSNWMKELVKRSFMKSYPVKVVPNGIDLSVFRFRGNNSVRQKYGIWQDRKILLGVADIWSKRKGLDDFRKLSGVLPQEYIIVLVGMSQRVMKTLPENIVGIPHTEDINELVEIYSEAFIFVNPSIEESFSLVTIEAMACGTPVIALDTSAVKELVSDENGIVLHAHDSEDYLNAIYEIERRKLNRENVAKCAEQYSVTKVIKRMVELYDEG